VGHDFNLNRYSSFLVALRKLEIINAREDWALYDFYRSAIMRGRAMTRKDNKVYLSFLGVLCHLGAISNSEYWVLVEDWDYK